jgi:ribosome-binding protein aMBF1 (putative translation factor)
MPLRSIGSDASGRSEEVHRLTGRKMPDKYKPPYTFSTHIGATRARKGRTFVDLAEKLKMDVTNLMQQCNGHAPPSKALVKGLAKELDIDESFLNRLAEEVRKDLG